jgi:hypothetical protein
LTEVDTFCCTWIKFRKLDLFLNDVSKKHTEIDLVAHAAVAMRSGLCLTSLAASDGLNIERDRCVETS